MKFHHIGIFVRKINDAKKILQKQVKIKSCSKIFRDRKLKVKVVFILDKNNIRYELVEPYGKGNPVDKVLKEKVNLLNHLGYKVTKFDKWCSYFRNLGYGFLTTPQKAVAFKQSRIVFMLSPLGFIVELIEQSSDKKLTK